MNRKLVMIFLGAAVALMVAIAVLAPAITSQMMNLNSQGRGRRGGGGDERDLPERDEIRQSYRLAAGARVDVSGINGSVEVETINDADAAEVHIVRSARNPADLVHNKVVIEHTPSSLVVRGEEGNKNSWRDGGGVRQRVMLRLPGRVELSAKNVNGPVEIGEVDGSVRVSSVNGGVEVEPATETSEVSGVNGGVTIAFPEKLSNEGMRLNGINGRVELRFPRTLNANLDVSGINGGIRVEAANVTPIRAAGEADRSSFDGRVGSGGPPIHISGINGAVRFVERRIEAK